MRKRKQNLPIADRKKGEAIRGRKLKENPVPIEIRFGKRVHELRLQRRLPQDVFANMAQVHRNYLSDVERGKRNVSIRVVDQIAKALGVDIKELFD